MFKKSFLFSILALLILLPNISLARTSLEITDWYIKDFHSDIVVNTDSSLLITENIVADCGNLPDKHGIFRVLPTQINTPEGKIVTPIELISITDFAGQPLKYSASKQNNTITWKIGDPNITVRGENTYQIVYKVKNAIRFQENFEELWWNLNGNFWELETDNYSADIFFPVGITKSNTSVEQYTGFFGVKKNDLAVWNWQNDVLHVRSSDILRRGEGISLSVSMPKNIFQPYKVTFVDKYPGWPWLFFPLFIFIVCFLFWQKYGRDPKLNRPVIAEYEAPDNLTPIQMSMLSGLGILKKEAITGSIIKFACDGIIKIEEIEQKKLFFGNKDFKFTIIDESKADYLQFAEKLVLEGIFNNTPFLKDGVYSNKLNGQHILLSEVKSSFSKQIPSIKKLVIDWLEVNGYTENIGYKISRAVKSFIYAFIFTLVFIFLEIGLNISGDSFEYIIFSFFLSIGLVLFFSIFMNKRTMKGTEVEWRIRGFKLFIETAEKYRARFYEKENMFEKILPYAIAFGLTDKWVKAMKDIYGAEKFAAMAPVWFIGSGGNFDIDSFSSALTSMTSAISQSTSSSTGAGGGGFSGGGGGGGGGGGW